MEGGNAPPSKLSSLEMLLPPKVPPSKCSSLTMLLPPHSFLLPPTFFSSPSLFSSLKRGEPQIIFPQNRFPPIFLPQMRKRCTVTFWEKLFCNLVTMTSCQKLPCNLIFHFHFLPLESFYSSHF